MSSARKNPLKVDKILNLQLSASSFASHKWNSTPCKQSIGNYHVTANSEKKEKDLARVDASILPQDTEDIFLSTKCISH